MVLTLTWPPNESGFYLAHRLNASLVLHCTLQGSMPFHDTAFAQPHNPAYMPVVFLDYKHPFTFLQRVANTLATAFFQYFLRDYRILSRQEQLLDKHFPNSVRPSLTELERNAALGLHFGHPLLLDGARPTAPNFQYVGMMNCRRADLTSIPKDVSEFIEGAGEHGFIFVSFGTAVQASKMEAGKRRMFLQVFGCVYLNYKDMHSLPTMKPP